MFKFIVQFVIILTLLWSNKKQKGSWVTPSGVLLGIYAICSFMAIFELQSGNWTQPFSDSYWLPMLAFDLFIILFLLPFRLYDETQVRTIRLPDLDTLNLFSTIIIILSLFSIVYYLSTVIYVFSSGDLGMMRDDRYLDGEYIESGLLNTIASVSAANYVFAIVLFFIYRILGNYKTRCRLLLISSFSNAIHVLAFVGRDGIIFWFFTFAFCYAFFKDYFNKKDRKKLIKTIAIIGTFLLIPFVLISISRFDASDIGTGGSIISYMGQSFIFGPLFFGIPQKPINVGSCFPLFYEIIGKSLPDSGGVLVIGDWMTGHFSTFVVNFYRALNLGGLIAITFLSFVFFRICMKNSNLHMNLGSLCIYLLYFQVISQGVFYFCHGERGGNLFIVTTLLLGLFFSVLSKSSRSIVLSK